MSLSNLPPLYDPIKRSKEVEAQVMDGEKRMYSPEKFRLQRFYGGIATAGSVGCNLCCAYCWNFERNKCPSGTFFSPSEIARKLLNIAKKGDVGFARISGCEPFLGDSSASHLAEVIDLAPDLEFVVETNGVILGHDPTLLERFKGHNNILFRVSIKATDGLSWERITGSNSWGYMYQQRAIHALRVGHHNFKVAYMPQFVDAKNIDVAPHRLEEENLKYYAGTKARLKKNGVKI
jgi:uncharacterized Fe-S cluster-containing radical SAM superfamily protein